MLTREEMRKKYGNSNMNTKNVFINWDAIDQLPENYEPRFTIIKFDLAKLKETFTNVGSKKDPSWYPRTELMYKIADAIGAEGLTNSKVEWISQEVDINPLLMKSIITDDVTMRTILVAARVTKQSKILKEDGTWRISPPETNEFNFFDRACLDFITEEERTNDYKKKLKWPDGKDKDYNYNTPKKREKRYLELKKFALQQAETKSFCKTIRVLAGLPTGFKTNDLQSGELVFSKYIKSKRLQKLETAARIDAIRQGKTEEIQDTSTQLFGNEQIEAPVEEYGLQDKSKIKKENEIIIDEPETNKNSFSDFQPEPDEKTKIKNQIEKYYTSYETVIEKVDNAKDAIANYVINYERITIQKLKAMLWKIENNIPGIKKMDHDIDLSEFGADVF